MNIKKRIICAIVFTAVASSLSQKGFTQAYQPKPALIQTKWAAEVTKTPHPEYPRPQLERKKWQNLNGLWEYAITAKDMIRPSKFQGNILVPFPVESSLSGVKKSLQPDQLLWYKRTFNKPSLKTGEKLQLNFGAVDFEATIYLNGKQVGKHTGGYQSFSVDVTAFLKKGANELVVRVWDPSDQGGNPHGKQVLSPEGIMYTPSSGIWQTVWLETVPVKHVTALKIIPDVDRSSVNVVVTAVGDTEVTLQAAGKTIKGRTNTRITIPVPQAKLWSPDDPYLYDLTVRLGNDEIKSYFGMRKVEIKKDEKGFNRIYLNGKYTYNLGTLDQGFWPDGLYTAPNDEALRFDIQASKAMGFNTIRKHIKIEPARWYYWADKLGMLIWQDMVNPGNDTQEGRKQFEKESAENIAQLYNHPSIVTWVLFNEKWGQYDQARLTRWIRQTDPTRLVNGHSGEMLFVNDELRSPSPDAWSGADMTDVHAYPMPGHMVIQPDKAAVIGEFGGIGVPVEDHLWDDLVAGWGYDGVGTPAKLKLQYAQMVDSLKTMEGLGLTASIYTQPFDVESEQNGLMSYDRKIIKLPVETLRAIHQKLWPVTANYKAATTGFSAALPNTVQPTYTDLLKQSHDGNANGPLLRKLSIMADLSGDTANARRISAEYIKALKDPFTWDALRFINRFTKTVHDPGFEIFRNNMQMVNAVLGKDEAEAKLTALIEADLILPNIRKEELPDWNAIGAKAIKIYGALGEEIFLQSQVLYAINHRDWESFGRSAPDWFEKYGRDRKWINPTLLNQMAWVTFNSTDNKVALQAAAMLSKRSIEMLNEAALLDTYANILYKLGHKQEALAWQIRAVELAPENHELSDHIEKMRKGEKTWVTPDNNEEKKQ